MIKAILFDFGGVYSVEAHHNIHIKTSSHTWKDMWRFFQILLNKKFSYNILYSLQEKLDLGEISLKEFYETLFLKIGMKDEKLLIKMTTFKSKKPTIDKEVKSIVQHLKKKSYLVVLCSNTISPAAKFNRREGCYKIFDKIFLSCEIGMGKQDGKLYKYTLKKINLKPEECLMVDDSPMFIRTAKELGIKTILYKRNSGLASQMKRFGVSI